MKPNAISSRIGSAGNNNSKDLLLQELIKARNTLRLRAESRPDIAYIKVSVKIESILRENIYLFFVPFSEQVIS